MSNCPHCGQDLSPSDNRGLWDRAMRHDLGLVSDNVEEPFVQPSPVFTLIRRAQADWAVLYR